MKVILLTTILLLAFNIIEAQNIRKKEAADVVNFIDTLVDPLKPSAYSLLTYFQKLKSVASETNHYKLSSNQTDSLTRYYENLMTAYDYAIMKATQNKTIDKFIGLKKKFLNMLQEGKKPWNTIMPAYINLFTKGQLNISVSEQNIITESSSIFMSSANKVLEYAKILADQEDEIEKKYHLQLHGDLYE